MEPKTYPPAFAGMAEFAQFILWRPVPRENGKTDKVPTCPNTRGNIDPQNPANWMRAEVAYFLSGMTGLEVGFVFTEADPFFFVDVDKALKTGEWSELGKNIAQTFQGCATELSHSGAGFHVFGRGTLKAGHRTRNQVLGLEVYTKGRFVALTGNQAAGDSNTDGSAALDWLYETYFMPLEGFGAQPSAEWTTGPCSDWRGPDDDAELIKRARRSRSIAGAFEGKASFADLWDAKEAKLSGAYPSPEGGFDHSSADAALLSHLAFWTGKDCARMERLFGLSELGQRSKWQDRDDYRERSVLGAVANCHSVYKAPEKRDPIGDLTAKAPDTTAEAPGPRQGDQWMDLSAQLDYFKGCAYVVGKHKVYVPRAGFLGPQQFKASFGGYKFAIDHTGKGEKNAFTAFTESQLFHFPKVYGGVFRPELGLGAIVKGSDGLDYVNTYYPAHVRKVQGDPAPFLGLLEKMLPDERDRSIFLAYLAACVQYPGVKFQWAPLIQGAEGNGKTLVFELLSKAVGEHYSYFPQTSVLGDGGFKFNGWLQGKLFVGVEEIYVPDRRDVVESLKAYITNGRMEIQTKGVDQAMGDNRANFIFCSNHKDAIPKNRKDRRYCIFFTAQQEAEDFAVAGMVGDYFPKLYDWARNQDGAAIVADFLSRYPIPAEFNPAGGCHRAPVTTSTAEALEYGLGPIEQALVESVRAERVGFKGGWISAYHAKAVIREAGKHVSPNKLAEVLGNVGYRSLGTAAYGLAPDAGTRSTLFVDMKRGDLLGLAGAEAARAYATAQGVGCPVIRFSTKAFGQSPSDKALPNLASVAAQ